MIRFLAVLRQQPYVAVLQRNGGSASFLSRSEPGAAEIGRALTNGAVQGVPASGEAARGLLASARRHQLARRNIVADTASARGTPTALSPALSGRFWRKSAKPRNAPPRPPEPRAATTTSAGDP